MQPELNTDPNPPDDISSLFGGVIHSYTRKQALADGFQVDVSTVAREAGLRFPTFLTRPVFDQYVAVPDGVQCQDEAGRLWDIVWMLRCAIQSSDKNADRILFSLYVRNTNGRPRLVQLRAVVAALDIDDPAPSLTIMLPDED